MNNNYYVYALIDPRNNSIFYVGKGKTRDTLNRVYRRISDHIRGHDGNNKLKNSVIRKIQRLGLEVKGQIIKEGLLEQEAFELEKELIRSLGKRMSGTGNLVNLTDGGEGSSGHVMSEETKKILSEKNKARIKNTGIVNFKGEHHSLETRARMSEIQKEICKNRINPMQGKKHTEETKKRISDKQKGHSNLPKHLWYKFSNPRDKNPQAKKYLFINPDGEKFEVFGFFKKFISDNHLSYDTCREYLNKGKIPTPKNINHSRMSKNRILTTGWEISLVKLDLKSTT